MRSTFKQYPPKKKKERQNKSSQENVQASNECIDFVDLYSRVVSVKPNLHNTKHEASRQFCIDRLTGASLTLGQYALVNTSNWAKPEYSVKFLESFDIQFVSEEMGFEPMIQKKLYVDLANQCLKPLSHTSKKIVNTLNFLL